MDTSELQLKGEGSKVKVNDLTADECRRILSVLKQDFKLRQQEQKRISQIKENIVSDNETRKSPEVIQHKDTNCVQCFSRFVPLINEKMICNRCHFNVCRKCVTFNKSTAEYICNTCKKFQDAMKMSNAWFYSNIERKHRNSGSSSVAKALRRRLWKSEVSPAAIKVALEEVEEQQRDQSSTQSRINELRRSSLPGIVITRERRNSISTMTADVMQQIRQDVEENQSPDPSKIDNMAATMEKEKQQERAWRKVETLLKERNDKAGIRINPTTIQQRNEELEESIWRYIESKKPTHVTEETDEVAIHDKKPSHVTEETNEVPIHDSSQSLKQSSVKIFLRTESGNSTVKSK